jgi:hypothetical protein
VETLSRAFRTSGRVLLGAPQLIVACEALGLDDPESLASPLLGEPAKTAASSWVRQIRIGAQDFFIKTYSYPTLGARWRGILRNTGPCCQSRAAREASALQWLAEHRFPAPSPVAVWERRRSGLLSLAFLITERWPGLTLEALLPTLPAADRRLLASSLGRFVAALHQQGFRDRNLDLRNLLARWSRDGFVVTKIDSPRYRLVRRGQPDDRLARADWARLLPQLEPFGIADETRAAAPPT